MPDINNTDLDLDAKKPFFSRVDWGAFWSALVVCFIVYFYTLAPTVTLEDSGELAVAGDWLGVPHPPGYPIWSMLAWCFCRLFSFVHYLGQPDPAWAIALMSAVFGALSAGISALLICRSSRDILRSSEMLAHDISIRTEDIICGIGGFSCSLLFAFTPIMWSQAVIVEVYSLNAFFLSLIMMFIYMWIRRPSNKTLLIAAFLFGLGLTNYQVILLAGIMLALCIMLRDYKLVQDFVMALIPYVIVFVLIMHFDKAKNTISVDGVNDMLAILFTQGALPTISHPTNITAFVYLFLNLTWLTVIYFIFPRGRTVAPTILLAQLGLAFYVYMPIVSDLRNPPMNWGYPRTWEGFLHAVTRGQYEKIIPAHIFSSRFIEQMGVYLSDLRLNYQLPIALIGFLPFAAWRINTRNRDYPMMSIAIILAIITVLLDLISLELPGIPLYKVSAMGVISIAVIGGLGIILARMDAVVRRHLLSEDAGIMEKTTTIIILLTIVGSFIALVARDVISLSHSLAAPNITEDARDTIFHEFGVIALMVISIILVVAAVYWMLKSKIIKLSVSEESQQWMMSTTITFVVLSIGLIALANLKMDIQDTFIQRVKFISSHMFFAFWIGYGIVFLLAHIDGWFKNYPALKTMAALIAIALPLTPILVNKYDKELIRIYGGAEQNGHDFGWQFGNYELRGAPAISEELSPDEEPLPNPAYPPPMETNAIFFGGTDPGRFVPTYMIYSADVRPDVYLITQNALADNTYMNVMRDLYGNDIWIPSVNDSAQAFRSYIDDIKSGRRPKTAGITTENGRVQISGVLGVMEINGILAKDIFDYNKWKHAFYVEESYVIRWMYPYLSPHGLIMKINHDRLPRLTPQMVNNDMDFWDWYSRRLISNEKFRRDVVARKSFSKLRSAIAGLYAFRGMRQQAETAFLEARKLYPLSPEANFRLAEVYMRSLQFDKALKLISDFSKMDPLNSKAPAFTNRIVHIEQIYDKIRELEKSSSKGKFSTDQALKLAEYYRQVGQMGRFNNLLQSIMKTKNLPPNVMFQVALAYSRAKYATQMDQALRKCMQSMPPNTPPKAYLDIASLYAKVGNPLGMRDAIKLYLKRKPRDWKAWLDLASLETQLKNHSSARQAINNALRYGGRQARDMIRKNPALNQLLRPTSTQQQFFNGLGL